jgi:hypothetical protein
MTFCLLIVCVLLLVYLVGWWRDRGAEHYGPCKSCDGQRMSAEGLPVINPFVWPYSGTSCVDDLYMLNADKGVNFGFSEAPITHLSTPDHVELVT